MFNAVVLISAPFLGPVSATADFMGRMKSLSADWQGNAPMPLKTQTAQEMRNVMDLKHYVKARIVVPSCFACGANDWGLYQTYGAVEAMGETGCVNMIGQHIVPNAGRWIQQEQPDAVTGVLLRFLDSAAKTANAKW